MRSLLLSSLVALGLLGAGCGAPSTVQGVVSGGEYRIQDPNPELRPGRGVVRLVLAEPVGDQLRVVSLTLPEPDALPLEVRLAIGEGDVELTASYGRRVEMVRSDGVRVLDSVDSVQVDAVTGFVLVETLEPLLAGHFEVTLEDGGRLLGDFVVDAE